MFEWFWALVAEVIDEATFVAFMAIGGLVIWFLNFLYEDWHRVRSINNPSKREIQERMQTMQAEGEHRQRKIEESDKRMAERLRLHYEAQQKNPGYPCSCPMCAADFAHQCKELGYSGDPKEIAECLRDLYKKQQKSADEAR